MRFMFLLIMLCRSAYGAGDGHGSPADLIPSFVNIGILASILIWKLRAPLKDFFKTKSESIEGMLSSATSKAKEAEEMMARQKKKNENVEKEVQKIQQASDAFVEGLKQEQDTDLAQRIVRLKQDATQKIETEKSDLAADLNRKLIENVIAKTKVTIKSDLSLSDSAANKLLEGMK